MEFTAGPFPRTSHFPSSLSFNCIFPLSLDLLAYDSGNKRRSVAFFYVFCFYLYADLFILFLLPTSTHKPQLSQWASVLINFTKILGTIWEAGMRSEPAHSCLLLANISESSLFFHHLLPADFSWRSWKLNMESKSSYKVAMWFFIELISGFKS